MLKLDTYSNEAALVGRLFYSSIFVLYGYFKLTGFVGTIGYMAKMGLPAPTLFAVLAVLFELVGGLMILVGYQTRLVALALAVYVFVAALIAHSHVSDPAQLVHFMKNMAIVGGSLALVACGAGRYSVDARNV
jgi:putative oxidoreductase